MSQSSADLIKEWQAERAKLEREIEGLRNGTADLTPLQVEAKLSELAELSAEYEALIVDFSRHEPIPIIFEAADSGEAEAVTRFRFAGGERRVASNSSS